MILIVTNKIDEHADILISELHERDIEFARVNTEDFPMVINGSFSYQKNESDARLTLPIGDINLSHIKSVWLRRPKPSVIDPKITDPQYERFARLESRSFLDGLWYSMPCRWVNSPIANRVAREKVFQLKKAMEIGFTIPNTLITNDPKEAKEFLSSNRKVVIKTLHSEAIVEGGKNKTVFTHLLTEGDTVFVDEVKCAPCILQSYIEKNVELRITVFGERVFAVSLSSQDTKSGQIDWRLALREGLHHEIYDLPHELEQKCVQFVRELGLLFGAIDMIVTPRGEYVFLEINPNGQWLWLEYKTGLPMMDAMIDLLLCR